MKAGRRVAVVALAAACLVPFASSAATATELTGGTTVDTSVSTAGAVFSRVLPAGGSTLIRLRRASAAPVLAYSGPDRVLHETSISWADAALFTAGPGYVGSWGPGGAEVLDLATGTRTVTPVEPGTSVIAVTPQALVLAHDDYYHYRTTVLLRRPGQPDVTVGETQFGRTIAPAIADERGIAIPWTNMDSNRAPVLGRSLLLIDPDAATASWAADLDGDPVPAGDDVYLARGGAITRVDRRSGTAAAVPGTEGAVDVTFSPELGLVWTARLESGGTVVRRLAAGADVATDLPVAAVSGSGLAAVGATLHFLDASGRVGSWSDPGAALPVDPQAPPAEFAGADQLVSDGVGIAWSPAAASDGHRPVLRRTVSVAGSSGVPGAVTLGPVETLVPDTATGAPWAVSGSWTAVADPATRQVVVRRSGAVVRTLAPAASAVRRLALSGPRLLIGTDSGSTLVDLRTGASSAWPRGAVVDGRWLAYVDAATHRVLRRDLEAAPSTTNPVVVRDDVRANLCSDYCATTPDNTEVQMNGGRVLVRYPTAAPENGRPAGYDVQVLDPRAGHVWGSEMTSCTSPSLGPRTIACFSGTEVETGSTSGSGLSGTIGSVSQPRLVAAGEVTGAFLRDDRRLQVQPYPFAVERPAPRTLASTAPPTISATGSGRRFTVDADVSKPLSAATVTIRTATGSVLRTLPAALDSTGTAVTASWDGRSGAGQPAASGSYTWILTGTAVDGTGALTGSDGITAGASGSVTVRPAPTAAVTAPALTSDASATPSFAVSWTASAGTVSYDVAYRELTRTSTGWAAGPLKPWLTGVTTRNATFAGVAGHTYRIVARAHDDAGAVGAWSTERISTVPDDDHSTLLRPSSGWSSGPGSGRYAGTLRWSGVAGAALSATTDASAIRIVGDRCARCGQLRLVVDGRVATTVDSYALTTKTRQVLAVATFTGAPGRHTVSVQVVGTRNRPTVYLDAVAFVR